MKPPAFITPLKQQFDPKKILTEPSDCWAYGYDNSRKHHAPDAVFFPTDTQDILQIVEFANAFKTPLIARGRATNTTGATVPLSGGIVLSLERMDKILDFDPDNRAITVQPGVLNETVQQQAKTQGFFWGPYPTSAPYCTVGGNLACNASGPRTLKYGATRDNILGLTAILGNGSEITCGVYTSKGAIGYDVTRLMIGSEGTLGIISEATLKLLPLPEAKMTIRAFYRDPNSAAQAVTAIMRQPVIPHALEYIDDSALNMARQYQKVSLPEEAGSLLMIELDGSIETLKHDAAQIEKAASVSGLLIFEIAASEAEAQAFWALRKALSQTLRQLSPHKVNEDVVVPTKSLPDLIAFTKELAATYTIPIVNFGHAGNGNIHVNMLIDPLSPETAPKAKACLNDLFDRVIALKGCLSGEHGIGCEKRDYLEKQLSAQTLDFMRQIKAVCDPNGILNPGKLIPDL